MAARRLGGSLLHRAQAAVAEEQRQLVPRRFLSGGNKAVLDSRVKAQQKKEELYDLIAEADKQFRPDRQNRRLLQHLSLHVKPRPDDPEWRWLTSVSKAIGRIESAGVMSSYLATCFLLGSQVVDRQKGRDLK